MDRSWMYFAPRASPQYVEGVEYFLDFAFEKTSNNGKILCPCIDCVNIPFLRRDKVYDHLICAGFKKNYAIWKEHGEVCKASSSRMISGEEGIFSHDMDGLLGDLFPTTPLGSGVDMGESGTQSGPTNSEPGEQNEKKKFEALLKEAEQKIYMDAKYTKLSCLVHLYHLKSLNGWSNKSFSMLLEFLQDLLPTGNLMPKTTHQVKKVEAENKKINRSKSDEPHVTGSKSFARISDEETQKNNGVEPSRGGMYCLTRTNKDGSIVNDKAAKVVEAIKTRRESSTAQEIRTDGPFWIDDDLSKVKGPERGSNVRCVGKFSAAKKRRVQDPQVPLLKAQVKGLREDFMSLVAAVKEHIPGLNLSTIISRANTNMEVDDACSVPDNSLAHNLKNPRSTGASHHPKNSRSTAANAHPKNSRSTATSPHPKNPTSGMSPHPKNPESGTGPQPKNPTSGPSRQRYSYYRK